MALSALVRIFTAFHVTVFAALRRVNMTEYVTPALIETVVLPNVVSAAPMTLTSFTSPAPSTSTR
jgi:hypothetical protein